MASGSPVNIKATKIILPMVIGLAIVGWMVYRDVDSEVLSNFHFTWYTALWITIAFLFMVGRDVGYMIRVRLFSRNELNWRQAFRVIMLWEFTSAITPSAVGGTTVATVFIHKEGLSVGKSATIVMLTAFFDELYFAIVFPILILIVGNTALFDNELGSHLMIFAWIGYALKSALLIPIVYGLFINPQGLKNLIVKVFRLRFLRRWKEGAERTGNDIILSSREIKKYRPLFWIKSFLATYMSWTSRFLVINALLMAFFTFSEHFLLYARQLVMWLMLVVAPTPGGSGFAEVLFQNFLGDIIPVDPATQLGTAAMLAVLWRIVTYYPYLTMGALIVPRWLDKSFKIHRKSGTPGPNAGNGRERPTAEF